MIMSSAADSQPSLDCTGEEAWEKKDPYQIPTAEDKTRSVWEGSCHCGKILYSVSREKPLASKYCHCGDCQIMHGAPFQWAAIFQKADLRFQHGTHGLAFYAATLQEPGHSLPCKVYCGACHTPIMDEGRNMVMLFPEVIKGIQSERGREAFKVRDHICWPARVVDEGVFERDGVRKWTGVDGRSELVDNGTGKPGAT